MTHSRILVVSLAMTLVAPSVRAESVSGRQPISYSTYDMWTSIRSLEESKAYSSLIPLLESLLAQRGVPSTPEVTDESSRALYDPEGVVYLLEDLAEVYAKGLIDFQRAMQYNRRALDAYESVMRVGLTRVPVSDYFNPRRMLYYYFVSVQVVPSRS